MTSRRIAERICTRALWPQRYFATSNAGVGGSYELFKFYEFMFIDDIMAAWR